MFSGVETKLCAPLSDQIGGRVCDTYMYIRVYTCMAFDASMHLNIAYT